MSSELIASPSSQSAPAGGQCSTCRSPVNADQRYCLECGERTAPMSGFLRGASPSVHERSSAPPAPPGPSAPPGAPSASAGGGPGSALTIIAGVGVLMLAMGVGVLIGRSGAARQSSAPAQVITVGSASGTSSGQGAAEAAFHSDWPASKTGYTVQLQKLSESGGSSSSVQAAKAAATAKGAPAVGALRSEEFASLTAGSYIVYSGVDNTRAQAVKALASLKKSFPSASVIRVSKGGSGAGESAGGSGGSGGGSGAGTSLNHPAPPSVLEGLKSTKGKSYEEKSKNLPNVVSTG